LVKVGQFWQLKKLTLRRVVPATNLVKVGQFWQLKKFTNLNHLEVLSLFAFVVNHSK